MTKLTPEQRAEIPSKDFGLPEKARSDKAKKETGNYPMPDRGHAISAMRLARKQRKDGNLSEEEFERITRKAEKKLRKGKDGRKKTKGEAGKAVKKTKSKAKEKRKKERKKTAGT
jgi:hypothetical protein